MEEHRASLQDRLQTKYSSESWLARHFNSITTSYSQLRLKMLIKIIKLNLINWLCFIRSVRINLIYTICFIQGRDGVCRCWYCLITKMQDRIFHFLHPRLCIEKSDLLLHEHPDILVKRCSVDLFVFFTPNQKIQ